MEENGKIKIEYVKSLRSLAKIKHAIDNIVCIYDLNLQVPSFQSIFWSRDTIYVTTHMSVFGNFEKNTITSLLISVEICYSKEKLTLRSFGSM